MRMALDTLQPAQTGDALCSESWDIVVALQPSSAVNQGCMMLYLKVCHLALKKCSAIHLTACTLSL